MSGGEAGGLLDRYRLADNLATGFAPISRERTRGGKLTFHDREGFVNQGAKTAPAAVGNPGIHGYLKGIDGDTRDDAKRSLATRPCSRKKSLRGDPSSPHLGSARSG